MTYVVSLTHLGNTFHLRRTIWTADLDRADRFETREAAQASLAKAKPFMKAAQFKAARIEETK